MRTHRHSNGHAPSSDGGTSTGASKRPLTVQIVAPLPPPYGGIAHWTQMLVRHAQRSSDVRLEVVDTAPRWRTIHDLQVWKRILGGSVQLARDLARVLRKLLGRPDAIHLTTSGQLAVVRDLFIALIARMFRVPLVYHIRFGRVPEIAAANTREWALMRAVLRRATVVVPIDEATEHAIRAREPSATVRRIPNCVDPRVLPGAPGRTSSLKTVVYLGWVIPTKGIGELAEAWSNIDTTGWRLILAGPVEDAYRCHIGAAISPGNVEFAGELSHDEAMRTVAEAEILVLPSYTEGFPNVVLEGMTLGRAILATAVGAIPEMLRDGRGVLVPPRDARPLAEALARLMADPELRAELGSRAREHALAVYSIDAVFAEYKKLWAVARTSSGC